MIELNKIYNEDCLEGMKRIPDNSIDCILTDPLYLYLKNQKLDRPFDEQMLFSECKRVLKKDGFIVLFGRGTSFYRWNCILADMGFTFKEEIVWNKGYNTSPLMNIHRIHETISIHTSGKGVIKKQKIPYIDMKKYDITSIFQDIKRLRSVFANSKSLGQVQEYLISKKVLYTSETAANNLSISSNIGGVDRCVNVVKCMEEGMNEKSIIQESRNHYKAIHPTEKPVRLLERLLNLVCNEGCTVLDPFSGSASTAIACINTKRNYIGFEIDKEYYDISMERLSEHQPKLL